MSALEDKTRKLASEMEGMHFYKVTGTNGIPDRMIIATHAFALAEFKRPNEPLLPAQIRRIKELRVTDTVVAVVNDFEYASELLWMMHCCTNADDNRKLKQFADRRLVSDYPRHFQRMRR